MTLLVQLRILVHVFLWQLHTFVVTSSTAIATATATHCKESRWQLRVSISARFHPVSSVLLQRDCFLCSAALLCNCTANDQNQQWWAISLICHWLQTISSTSCSPVSTTVRATLWRCRALHLLLWFGCLWHESDTTQIYVREAKFSILAICMHEQRSILRHRSTDCWIKIFLWSRSL